MDTKREFEFEEKRLAHFVNRATQLKRAREIITITEPAGESLPVIVFCGSGGMGKTSLLHKIRLDCCQGGQVACVGGPDVGQIPYALVDFSAAGQGTRSRAGMLAFIKRELAREAYGIPFPRYELVSAKYWELTTQRAFKPQEASIGEFGTLLEAASQFGQAWGGVAGLVKLLAEKGAKWYTEWRDGPLSAAGLAEWVQPHEAEEALARALAADILAATSDKKLQNRYSGYRWPVLMFDSVEWLDLKTEEGGLTLEAMGELCDLLPETPILIGERVGESGPRLCVCSASGCEVEQVNVDVIPEEFREEFLGLRGVAEGSWGPIIEVTQGHALWMGVAADIALVKQGRGDGAVTVADLWDQKAVDKTGKPLLSTLLKRLLEQVGEGMRDLVRAACVCRWFDRELLRAVAGTTGTLMDDSGRLRGFSFVEPAAWGDDGEPTRWAIHQVVRELTLAELRGEGMLEEFAARGAVYCEEQEEEWRVEGTYFEWILRQSGIEEMTRILIDGYRKRWQLGIIEELTQAIADAIGASGVGAYPCVYWWGLALLLEKRGQYGEALEMYGQVLAGASDAGTRARMLRSRARLECRLNRRKQAIESLNEALQLGEGLPKQDLAETLGELAVAHRHDCDWAEAESAYARALDTARRASGKTNLLIARLTTNRGVLYRQVGRWPDALEAFEEGLRLKSEVIAGRGEDTDHRNLAINLWQLGDVLWLMNRYVFAEEYAEKSRLVHTAISNVLGIAACDSLTGRVCFSVGRFEEANTWLTKSVDMYTQVGPLKGSMYTAIYLARTQAALGDTSQALGVLAETEERIRQACRQDLLASALAARTEALLLCGQSSKALNSARQAVKTALQAEYKHGLAEAQLQLGRALMACVELPDLAESLAAACREFATLGDRHGEGRVLMNMGIVMKETGEVGKAKGYWREALEVLDGMGVPEEEKVRGLLAGLEGLEEMKGDDDDGNGKGGPG